METIKGKYLWKYGLYDTILAWKQDILNKHATIVQSYVAPNCLII